MKNQTIQNIDGEEASELLVKIEKSFSIKFCQSELMQIKTLGELADLVLSKIEFHNSTDCTTQQAFYKLRDAITNLFRIDRTTITTDFALSNFLPRQNRKERIRDLEEHLNVHLKILSPLPWVTNTLLMLLLMSIVALVFNWQFGLLGLCISLGGLWLSNKNGNELDLQTVGQVAEKMTRENYLKSRRNAKTVNKAEIEKLLIAWFADDMGFAKSDLTREARFV